MASVTGSQVKKILKAQGVNTRDIRVTTSRSFIRVELKSWALDKPAIEVALAQLHTAENISHDWDSIWVGDSVVVNYKAPLTQDMVMIVLTTAREWSHLPEYDPKTRMGVERLARILLESKMLPSGLGIYDIKDLLGRCAPWLYDIERGLLNAMRFDDELALA